MPVPSSDTSGKEDVFDQIEAEPDFGDPQSFQDTITDEELLGDLLKNRPKLTDATEAVIIVDGIPVVGSDRFSRLQNVIEKIFAKCGKIVNTHYPKQNDETVGYMFLEYASRSAAVDAAGILNGQKLDKQHTLTVNLFSDFEKYLNVPDKWEPPKPKPYKDFGNLKSWILNHDCYDQFAIMHEGGDKVAVLTNTPAEPTVVTEKIRWTETRISWSPRGSYLATMHEKGIALWGGEKFEQINRFAHPGVELIDFSPCETYLVTYAHPKTKYQDSTEAIKIWDIRTGEMKRVFPGGDIVKKWPHFKWNFDDTYFACLKQDSISVYETSTFSLLEKKSIKIDNVRDFQWSPTDNFIAYWVEECNQIPARVALMNILTRQDIRTKNTFNVSDANIYWQKSGDHVLLRVDRYGKKKKEAEGEFKYSTTTQNLEVFLVREKNIPIDSLELKETIQCIEWEPTGSKFAVIHGDIRFCISFYSVKSGIQLLKTITPKQQVNAVFWAPPGKYCVLANLKSVASGSLLFVDATLNEVVVMNNQEHTGVTDVEWDPTGRYVVSAVSSWSGRGTYGYFLWNFQGKLLQQRNMDRFCQLLWRPRPPSLLNKQKIDDVRRNMKRYAPIFEERDKQIKSKASKEIIEKRQTLKQDFDEWRSKRKAEWLSEKPKRMELRGGLDTDDILGLTGAELEEETIEYLIREEEVVLSEE